VDVFWWLIEKPLVIFSFSCQREMRLPLTPGKIVPSLHTKADNHRQ
jgi:hypothetical protein